MRNWSGGLAGSDNHLFGENAGFDLVNERRKLIRTVRDLEAHLAHNKSRAIRFKNLLHYHYDEQEEPTELW